MEDAGGARKLILLYETWERGIAGRVVVWMGMAQGGPAESGGFF